MDCQRAVGDPDAQYHRMGAQLREIGFDSRSLHFAPPDFLCRLVASANFMRLSLRRGAFAVLSSAAWQEIRVRFGRDDNSVANSNEFEETIAFKINCHPDRSVAKWWDLLLSELRIGNRSEHESARARIEIRALTSA